ncbi:TlpA disulfide reductase family protein [soil metagenome]
MNSLNTLFLALAVIFMLPACNTSESADETGYLLKGKMANATGTTVFLDKWDNLTTATPVDTAIISKEGDFTMKKPITGRGLYMLRVSQERTWLMVLEPGATVNFEGDLNDVMKYNFTGHQPTVVLNNLVKDLGTKNRRVGEINQEFMNAQYSGADQAALTNLQNEYMALQQGMVESLKTFADTVSDPLLAIFAISNLSVEDNADFLRKITDKALVQDPNLNLAKEIAAKVGEATKIAVGKPAPDFTLKTPTGESIQLSSLKGQVVLIDFWASWCKPCRAENPNLVRTYEQYKNKGFTIYSISLDKELDAWVNAIKQDNLTWKNHGSNLLFWNCPVVRQYNVNSIPAAFLIDKEGNIIAKNLRGVALDQKLAEVFGS